MEQPQITRIPHWKLLLDQGIVTDEIANYPYPGSGTEEDPYLVSWLPNDPRNPMTFPEYKKWMYTLAVSISTLAVALVSSAYSGGVAEIMADFHIGTEVATLGISLFVLGFAIGPLLWAPLSELFGRQYLFTISYCGLTIFNAAATGAKNPESLIIFRFFAGCFGSSPLTNAGGIIADMFSARHRGLAMSLFASAPFMGPVIGPIVGGFLGESAGWKWVMGLLAAFSGTVWIACSLFVPETYGPVLLRRRAARLSSLHGKVYLSQLDAKQGGIPSLSQAFKTSLSRPWILLFKEPIVLLLSIYMAIIYGTLYMLFAAFPIVYQQNRGWSQGISGLAFLGILIGMLCALAFTIYDNKRYIDVQAKHNGFAPPEARLPPCMIASIAVPVGLFWFAWTNYPSIHWLASIAAGAPFGFGMVLLFLSVMNYLIDSYTIFAASVLAANSVLRSIFGAVFPLFTTYMYADLGIHWASSIPAFLALACVPFPFLFYKYGAAIRQRCKFAAQSDAFMRQMMEGAAAAATQKPNTTQPPARAENEASPVADEKDIELGRQNSTSDSNPNTLNHSSNSNVDELPSEPVRRSRTFSLHSRRASTVDSKPAYEENPYDIDRVHTRESFK
ncbi:MFS transporter [Aspergillus melleus]|uniref:MFS transporter n=1 Tax=Aspergillus melleus TaxID=138277 RepID=UPI001E8E8B29|nr:uncharacterized protein LDX57_002990 [Aspergillus melleus]KAH8425232.1 hypothetical protein LDX57_002990 [Aspergillus melleus]